MNGAQHTSKPLHATPEFTRRAATAWIRAADAGLIDAGELAWLLAHLPPDPQQGCKAASETGASSDRDIRIHPARVIHPMSAPNPAQVGTIKEMSCLEHSVGDPDG